MSWVIKMKRLFERVLRLDQDGDNDEQFRRIEHTSLVENRIDCGEEEFGNDFHASL